VSATFSRWPAPDPRVAPRFNGRPIAVCDKCSRYTDKTERVGEFCNWLLAGGKVCTGRFYLPPSST